MTETYAEAKAFHAAAEKNWDAAVAIYRQAKADFKRSKSAKNRAAYAAAFDNSELTAEICRNAQDRMRRLYEAEARLAAVAERRAVRDMQGNLF